MQSSVVQAPFHTNPFEDHRTPHDTTSSAPAALSPDLLEDQAISYPESPKNLPSYRFWTSIALLNLLVSSLVRQVLYLNAPLSCDTLKNAQMSLLSLPNELLCQICESLTAIPDIGSIAQVNRQLNRLIEAQLYRCDARETKSSALLWAAAHGLLDTAKKALKALKRKNPPMTVSDADEIEPETVSSPIDAALFHAAENNHDRMVRLLVESSADWDWREPERDKSAMEVACLKGHIGTVKVLLELGADPSDGYYMKPYPIQCAAMMGHTNIVRLLVSAGACPDTCSGRPEGGSFPPLQLAVRGDHEETAKFLIAKGAKINLRVGRMHTALEEAVMANRLWAVRLLLASGAMVFAPSSGSVRSPALECAMEHGREEVLKLLRNEEVHIWPRRWSEGYEAAIGAMP